MRSGLAAALAAIAFLVAPAVADAADEATLARGETLFQIGGCANCHTAKDGQTLAGGDGLVTQFGTFYPSNITPDPSAGIGGWSDADFIRAMREGVARGGERLYPAFPYTSYTHMTDEDLVALKAYLDTIPPVAEPSRPHDLDFPFSIRELMIPWQMLFFTPERFAPQADQSAEWNRGAYLVRGPGHCAECHTPRNIVGVLDRSRSYAGAVLQPGNRKVPNITSDAKDGIGDWSDGDLTTFFELGMKPNGDFVGGEMGKIIANGTGKLSPEDRKAIVVYLKSLPPLPNGK